jgi:hypothetical protein
MNLEQQPKKLADYRKTVPAKPLNKGLLQYVRAATLALHASAGVHTHTAFIVDLSTALSTARAMCSRPCRCCLPHNYLHITISGCRSRNRRGRHEWMLGTTPHAFT